MIKLYGFGESLGVIDPSPFVAKVILYMNIANIPYEAINGSDSLQKAPRGKLPFIDDNGKVIPDSYAIIKHLNEQYNVDINKHLSECEKAQAYLIERSLDEDFYWQLVYSRWHDDDAWAKTKTAFFDDMPIPLKWIIPGIARKSVIARIKKQGIALRDKEEIQALAKDTLNSLNTLLGDKNYFFGDKVSSLDISVYSTLSQLILSDTQYPLNDIATEYSQLVAFTQRFHEEFVAQK